MKRSPRVSILLCWTAWEYRPSVLATSSSSAKSGSLKCRKTRKVGTWLGLYHRWIKTSGSYETSLSTKSLILRMLAHKFLCNVNDTRASICVLVTSQWGQIWDPWDSQVFTIAHVVICLSLHIHSFYSSKVGRLWALTRFLVPKVLVFLSVLTKQFCVLPSMVDRWHHLILLSLKV